MKDDKNKVVLIVFLAVIAFICIGITSIGALFKIMHWPGADMLLIMGMIAPIIAYAICLIIFIVELLNVNLKYKWVWILCLIFNPIIVAILYYINKDKLIEKTN